MLLGLFKTSLSWPLGPPGIAVFLFFFACFLSLLGLVRHYYVSLIDKRGINNTTLLLSLLSFDVPPHRVTPSSSADMGRRTPVTLAKSRWRLVFEKNILFFCMKWNIAKIPTCYDMWWPPNLCIARRSPKKLFEPGNVTSAFPFPHLEGKLLFRACMTHRQEHLHH